MATTTTQAPPTSDPNVVARLASKRDKWKAEAAKQAGEKAAAEKTAADLRTELDALKKADAPARVKELEGQLRTMKHRTAFDALAKESGAKDKALDTLYRESGYKADGDEPDPKAMKEALKALRESHDFAFDEGDEEGESGADKDKDAGPIMPGKRETPAPDAGRGGRHKAAGSVVLTREQLMDPKFMLDPKNSELKKNAKIKF